MMLFHTDGKRLKSHFTTFSVLVFHLHLTHFCKGEFQLIGSSLPIVATLGDDIILPCLMRPAEDASGLTLEWTRPDLSPRFVYVWRSGQELEGKKHKFFEGRTSLFIDELRLGNISLKLSKVKLTDEGQYRCFIPALGRQSSIQLVVGSNAVSTPVITLTGIDEATSGVVLQCESTGWYPEPEVFWLDAEGNLLSAGPTETVRGPDDLYTVSSRVTVEKRHSNSFTCRVQQNHINQTRETLIHVPDVFFEVQLNFSTITTGLAVGLAVCILVILLLVFFVWRQNKTKTKRSHRDETNKRVKKKCLKSNKTEDQFVTRQPLMTHETVQMKVFNEGNDKNIRPEIQEGQEVQEEKQLQEGQEVQKEQQRREETENRVKTLKEELGTKKTEVKKKQADLQLLHEEKQRKEENLQRLKEHLENKNTELETIMASLTQFWVISLNPKKEEELKKKQEVEKEVETLKKELETEETELDTKIKEFDDKLPEVQQFKGEIQMMESTLQTLIEELDSKNLELERTGVSTVLSSSSSWPLVSRQKFQAELQKFQEEHQKREEAENQVRILEEKLEKKTRELEGNQVDTIMQLLQEKQKRQKAQREVDALKNQSQSKINEVDSLRTRVKKLSEENLKLENKKKEYEEKAQAGNTTWKRTNEELKEAKAQVKNMKEEISQLRTQYDNLLWNVKEKGKKAEKDLMTKNTERGACKCEAAVHNTSSPSQRSTTGPVIEVDPRGKYVRLKNASKEDQHLEGWMLQVLVNNKNIMYTFEKSFKISPGKILTLWDPNHGIHYPPTDLIWKDLHSLSSGDQLQVILFNNTRETKSTQSTCIER
ncbi:uncharacterized protein [Pagrus major]|uniref:uncharacterized protein n=1 Tax=Pagrus major TaxID=143350 RepID=UPI003CC8CE65